MSKSRKTLADLWNEHSADRVTVTYLAVNVHTNDEWSQTFYFYNIRWSKSFQVLRGDDAVGIYFYHVKNCYR